MVWQEAAKRKPKLRNSTVFMAWKSAKSGSKIASQGRNVILAPVQYLYFDQQYKRSKREPGHTWSTPVSTQKTYAFSPAHSS